MVFSWVGFGVSLFDVGFVVRLRGDGHFFWECIFLLRFVKILSFMIS